MERDLPLDVIMCVKFPCGSEEQNEFGKLKEGESQRDQEDRGVGTGKDLRKGGG